MGTYQRQDHYYKKAKTQGLPSRAAFKMEEIMEKFHIVRKGAMVLDLGAAPGGWTVILAKAVGPGGKVLAVDLQPLSVPLSPPIIFLQADFQSPEASRWIQKNLREKKADCICSDMSPKLSGIAFKDAYQSYQLGIQTLAAAKRFLKVGGNMVTKMFPGGEFKDFLKTLKGQFNKVKVFEPKATRKTSREVYILGMGFLR